MGFLKKIKDWINYIKAENVVIPTNRLEDQIAFSIIQGKLVELMDIYNKLVHFKLTEKKSYRRSLLNLRDYMNNRMDSYNKMLEVLSDKEEKKKESKQSLSTISS